MLTVPQEPRRLSGYLRLTAGCREDNSTYLSQKAFRAPMHISKPYWDNNSLLVNAMSPTAGLLEGDHIDIEVDVESHASLTLSNPAALRVHKMDTGRASLDQTYHIANSGFLETNPEWLIPQAYSRFSQRTTIRLEPKSELFFIEAIAPGRVAHGERFAFQQYRNNLRIEFDGTLAALERYDLQPSNGGHAPWSKAFDAPYFVSIFLVSTHLDEQNPIWKKIHELSDDTLLVGSSKLACGPCWNAKLLGPDPARLRATIEQIRKLFYRAIDRTPTNLRRQ